ncbi:MAG: M23 family metallopeptidase [Alphaproteobacteria bacterium]
MNTGFRRGLLGGVVLLGAATLATMGVAGLAPLPEAAIARAPAATAPAAGQPTAAMAGAATMVGAATRSSGAGGDSDPAIALANQPLTSPPLNRQIEVSSGDTLMDLLLRSDIDRQTANSAVAALRDVYDPRRLRVGQQVDLRFARDETDTDDPSSLVLQAMVLPLSYDREARVERTAVGGYAAAEVAIELESAPGYGTALIESSLLGAGGKAGIPQDVMAELVRIYSFDVDFQRDLRTGDDFEVFYESFVGDSGDVVHNGDVLYARLTLSGTPLYLYRFESADGTVDYFNQNGESVRKALMKTPIDGARLSSTFGPRRHPVLGYTRMHQGADFAAPTGTPVYAAGDGVVEMAGTNGGYGRYVRIRHNGSYDTAYAHLSRIAVSAGKRVRQGQVIGYVGTSGLSTGPHLHYEVMHNGIRVNPLGLKLPTGKTLTGSELAAFHSVRQNIDQEIAGLPRAATVARNRTP